MADQPHPPYSTGQAGAAQPRACRIACQARVSCGRGGWPNAPEQHAGTEIGPAADQFAFCVALHEAVHGEHPFASDTFGDLLPEGLRSRPSPLGRY